MTQTATMWRLIEIAVLAFSTIHGTAALAQLPIDVDVATQKGVPLSAPQEWAQVLGELGLAGVRVRGSRGNENPEVTKVEDGPSPRFKVLALLDSSGNLVLPERRFRVSDRKLLKTYFEALGKNESFGEEIGGFGLTKDNFAKVFKNLSQPLGFATKGKTPAEVLEQVEGTLGVAIVDAAQARAKLRSAEPLDTELRGFTSGTALAIAVRKAGFVLRPEKPAGEPVRLVLEPERPQVDAWPVGWKPEGSPRMAAPKLYEFLTIEVSGYTLAKALEALEPRLGLAIIYDERTLAARDIQPDQIKVKLPSGKTFLKRVVDKLLSQARLAGELRVDEASRPFYWVTQFGPDSPRAQ